MGEAKRKQALLATAEAEMKLWQRPIVLQMDLTTTLAVCGALQLTLRHPEFVKRPSATAVREVVMAIRDQIPPDWPGLRGLIELGFHPRFDT